MLSEIEFMRKKYYTVVALCLCGCDQVKAHHVRATSPAAAQKQIEDDHLEPVEDGVYAQRVVAVFPGRHCDEDIETRKWK